MYSKYFKRLFDVILSFVGLIIISPLLMLVSVFLFLSFKDRKIIFTQQRVGKNNKTFRLIKFKTMDNLKDQNGKLLPDIKRITKMGRFLRENSIDELPQIYNVLKGDMSLIGPRPLLVSYIKLYSGEQARRHEVRPGITGWAQINGRNNISWQKKFELDVWYVNNISARVDLKIFFMTFKKVIIKSEINSGDKITMPAFNGKN